MEGYDGPQIVGMDLHRKRSVLVRMTEDGGRLGTAKITNSPAELRRVIALAGSRPRVVLEATYGWYWAADALAAVDPASSAGAKLWSRYLTDWTFWNHLRTAASTAAMALFVLAVTAWRVKS